MRAGEVELYTFRQLVCNMVPVYIVCVNSATATIPLGSLARQPFHFRFGGKGTSGHFRQVLVGTAEMLAEPIRLHSGQL